MMNDSAEINSCVELLAPDVPFCKQEVTTICQARSVHTHCSEIETDCMVSRKQVNFIPTSLECLCSNSWIHLICLPTANVKKCKVSAGIFEQCLIPNSWSLSHRIIFKKLSFIVHILNPYTSGEKQHSLVCSLLTGLGGKSGQ